MATSSLLVVETTQTAGGYPVLPKCWRTDTAGSVQAILILQHRRWW
ncbi:MAG: hypothetical protein ACTJGP_10645 [Proteus vulgaris]|nr:hypothetical protein [Proteus vulgaris]